jgi:molybdenum cofactor cytidylyltransferase
MNPTRWKPKIATVILAAGESKRMHGVKQLLPWKGSSLLGHAIEQALKSDADQVYVVLGANKDIILKEIDTSGITVIINDAWALGMGTSIGAAMNYFKAGQLDFDGILMALIDQPLLDVKHYNILINKYIDSKNIIATSYGSGSGVPAVFDKSYFDELIVLSSDKGAKNIILKHKNKVLAVDAGNRTIDLDTRETYLQYYEEYGK